MKLINRSGGVVKFVVIVAGRRTRQTQVASSGPRAYGKQKAIVVAEGGERRVWALMSISGE